MSKKLDVEHLKYTGSHYLFFTTNQNLNVDKNRLNHKKLFLIIT